MSSEGIKKISEIEFYDMKVSVYYDKYSKTDSVMCSWRMRNPDSCYQGEMYMNNETGKISYPWYAIILKQTDEDREILPQFIITGKEELTKEDINNINIYLEKEYLRRNNKTI